MKPNELSVTNFKDYPPQSRELADKYLSLLKQLPLAFLAPFLRELIRYDWKFPVEQEDLLAQLGYLNRLPASQRSSLMSGFANLHLPADIEEINWVQHPEVFTTRLSAILWSTSQITNFTTASESYIRNFYSSWRPANPSVPRLTVVALGNASDPNYALFRKLRRQGAVYNHVSANQGSKVFEQTVRARAQAHPAAFAHWMIDGGVDGDAVTSHGFTNVSYRALAPVRRALLGKIRQDISAGDGPEDVHANLLAMQPGDFGFDAGGNEGILNRFKLDVLTQGSGTQIFSTSFVEWAASEAMRRAQPLIMMVRYTPRRRSASMDEMLSANSDETDVDPKGSLIDADMGAYYIWLSTSRIPGARDAIFIAWCEGEGIACCVSPHHVAGSVSNAPIDLDRLIADSLALA